MARNQMLKAELLNEKTLSFEKKNTVCILWACSDLLKPRFYLPKSFPRTIIKKLTTLRMFGHVIHSCAWT